MAPDGNYPSTPRTTFQTTRKTIRASRNSARKNSREPARFRLTVDSKGRTIWIVDAHRDDRKRFIVHAPEKLTAFLQLESAIRACGESHKRALHTLNLHIASET